MRHWHFSMLSIMPNFMKRHILNLSLYSKGNPTFKVGTEVEIARRDGLENIVNHGWVKKEYFFANNTVQHSNQIIYLSENTNIFKWKTRLIYSPNATISRINKVTSTENEQEPRFELTNTISKTEYVFGNFDFIAQHIFMFHNFEN